MKSIRKMLVVFLALFMFSVPVFAATDIQSDRKLCTNIASWGKVLAEARDNGLPFIDVMARLSNLNYSDRMDADQYVFFSRLAIAIYGDQSPSVEIVDRLYRGCMKAHGYSEASNR